jgi:Protein of unknown function (DUF559)
MTDVGDLDPAIPASGRPRLWGVVEVAERQHGVVAHRQLVALGVSASSIQDWIVGGRLHRIHTAVYALGHRRLSLNARRMAAVLAFGPTALLSHRDAAALWDLLRTSRDRIDVTTARRCKAHRGVTLHRSRRIDPEDRVIRDGIPVTSVARTLLDIAEVIRPALLSRALEQAELLGLFDLHALERLIARSRGRHGLRALKEALRIYRPPAFTRSGLERRFLDLCRDAGLPRPSANLFVAGGEADMVWHEARVVVELDGRDTHRTLAAFEQDRIRDTELQLAGYRVLRVTDRRLRDGPEALARVIRSLLGRRAERG